MNDLIKDTKETFAKQGTQSLIALLFTLSLCYVVTFGGGAEIYKDLFAYAVTGTLGFYFGRETKAKD